MAPETGEENQIFFGRADKLVGHGFSLDDAVYRELFTDANPEVREFLVLSTTSASAQASNSAQTSASAFAGLVGEEDANARPLPPPSSLSSGASSSGSAVSSSSAFSSSSTLVHDQDADIRALSNEATAENQWRADAAVFIDGAKKAIASSREYRTSSPLPQQANHQLTGRIHLAELGDLVNVMETYLAKPPSLTPLDAEPSRAQQDKTVQALAHLKPLLDAEYGHLAKHITKSEPPRYSPRMQGYMKRFNDLLARTRDLAQLKAKGLNELKSDLGNLGRAVRSDLETGKETDSLLEGPTEADTLRTLSDDIADLERRIEKQQALNAVAFSKEMQELRVQLRQIRSAAIDTDGPFHNGPAAETLLAPLHAMRDQLQVLSQPENLPFDYRLAQKQVDLVGPFVITAEALLKLVKNLVELDRLQFFEPSQSSQATGQHRQGLNALQSENTRLIEQLTNEAKSEQRRV